MLPHRPPPTLTALLRAADYKNRSLAAGWQNFDMMLRPLVVCLPDILLLVDLRDLAVQVRHQLMYFVLDLQERLFEVSRTLGALAGLEFVGGVAAAVGFCCCCCCR